MEKMGRFNRRYSEVARYIEEEGGKGIVVETVGKAYEELKTIKARKWEREVGSRSHDGGKWSGKI